MTKKKRPIKFIFHGQKMELFLNKRSIDFYAARGLKEEMNDKLAGLSRHRTDREAFIEGLATSYREWHKED